MPVVSTRAAALAVLCVVLLSGCGKESRVTGEVTYDGAPVAKGTITFLPADGKGVPVGGPIVDGKYAVGPVEPGPKIVQVEATRDVKFARSSEEMAQMAAAAKARGNPTGLIEPADIIPPNAVGNNAQVTIGTGAQTHSFNLTSPGKRSR